MEERKRAKIDVFIKSYNAFEFGADHKIKIIQMQIVEWFFSLEWKFIIGNLNTFANGIVPVDKQNT